MIKIRTRATTLGLNGEASNRNRSHARKNSPKRYSFLEDSSMSRAMCRL